MACLLLTLPSTQATPLALSNAPPSNTGNEPRPNVIVTVDDSGSMSDPVAASHNNNNQVTKISALKSALTSTFGSTTLIPDGRIRLAWQSLHDNGNFITNHGATSIKLGAKNAMKLFSGTASGTHRANFNSFVTGLSANDVTPSMSMMKNVFTYMNAPENVDSPWADTPGTSQSTPYLACRRTYHIFMTDGVWNSQAMPSCTNSGSWNTSLTPNACDNSSPASYSCSSSSQGWVVDNSSSPPTRCKLAGTKGSWTYDAAKLITTPAVPNTSVAMLNPDYTAKGDGFTQTLGDGTTSYQVTSTNNQIKVYRDLYGNDPALASTLSDWIFRNWATDLQDGNAGTTQTNSTGTSISGNTQNIVNSVRPLIKKSGVETVTDSTNHTTQLQEFWNPKNDSASWQHVTQYMIGFGTDAVTWGVAPLWDSTSNSTYGGDYAKLVNGTVAWPDVETYKNDSADAVRAVELWHGAINGRGKFIPATDAAALTQAFTDILGTVLQDSSKPLITVTTSSSTLRTGASAFIAGYKAENWAGQLMARPLDASNAAVGATLIWDAAALLDDAAYPVASRFVFSYSSTAGAGISWSTYTALPSAQQTPLNKNSSGTVDSNGQNRVDYIRGDHSKEQSQSGGIFRDRGSRLGDVVNSNIWYVGKPASGYTMNGYGTFRGTGTGGQGGRTPMVYIGANDGMLHGVAAATTGSIAGGTELLAYIPQGIAENALRTLSDIAYTHQYFVDGSPFTGDAYISTPARSSAGWATVLVGTLGAGGKGYFVLDVTDPANFTVTKVANLVIKDTTDSLTGTKDADIGVITSPPVVDDAIASKSRQIVQMNNGRWAVVMGNGANSVNEAPVLLIQYLDGDKSIKKLSPCGIPVSSSCSASFKGGNGLVSPQLIDLNGDGRVDVAYAGDLLGNLWKFNLSSASDTSWGLSFGGDPFFVAKGRLSTAARPSASVTQPVTSAPYFMQHPLGGIMVSFGTGRNLTVADQTSTGIDSYYALWDNSTFTSSSGIVTITDGTPINTSSSTALPTTTGGLVQQTIAASMSDAGTTFYTSSTNPVVYTTDSSSTKRGWYIDLSLASGERVLLNTRLFTGESILVTSTIPKSGASSTGESCTASATSEVNFMYVLNMFTGKPPETPAFELSTTPTTPPNIITVGGGDTAIVENTALGKKYVVRSNSPPGVTSPSIPLTMGSFTGLRVNWREKQ